jgi:hypothetical protein
LPINSHSVSFDPSNVEKVKRQRKNLFPPDVSEERRKSRENVESQMIQN